MSGWEKVAAATVLALIGLAGLNLAIWRRMRDAIRQQQPADERSPPAEPTSADVI